MRGRKYTSQNREKYGTLERNFWNSPISENSGWKMSSFWFLMYGMRTSGPGLAGSNSPCTWEMSMARMNLLRIRLTSISSSSSRRCCMRSASSLLWFGFLSSCRKYTTVSCTPGFRTGRCCLFIFSMSGFGKICSSSMRRV